MRILPYGAVCALLLAASAAYAQTPVLPLLPPLTDATETLRQGIELHDKGEYDAAIARYASIVPGDSLYATVQGELSLTYLAAERYQEAADAARRALDLHYADPQPYITLASAEDALKHPAQAQAAFQAGLKLFPYQQRLWYNQGLTEIAAKQFPQGLASVRRSLELRPAHLGSHYVLAGLASRQGQTSHAMLSLLAYLLIEPEGENSNGVLVELEQHANHAMEVLAADQIPTFTANEAFRELDLLLDSKVALRKEYVSKVKFDASLVKQLQLLVEKFPASAAPTDDIWVRLYAPLVAALRQGDNLTTATYTILASADDKKAANWVKSNKKKVDKLYEVVSPALLALRNQQPVTHNGQTTTVQGWFDENELLNGLGEGTVQGEERRFTGPWVFVTPAGAVEEEGTYGADFKRTGVWRSYNLNGHLARTTAYLNGEAHGPTREFYDNGQLASETTFVRGKSEGEAKRFTYCGALSETRTFRQGLLDGPYATFYPDGKPQLRVQLRDDKQEGRQTTLYPNGAVELEYTFVAGKMQGPFVVNYPDTTPEKRGTYDQDELHGAYTEYFSNGKIMNTGAYTRGKRTGTWKEYFADGKLSAEKTYDETGELHGLYHDYNYQGQLYADIEYDHGRTTRQRYYDATTGRSVLDTPIRKGRVEVVILGVDGVSKGSGTYLDGQMEGEWRWTYANGQVQRIRHYKSGQLHGGFEEYYANGQLKLRTTYQNDVQEGAYELFQRDGQRSQTGYYRNGLAQGPWREYYVDGRVSEESAMHQGQKNGPTRSLAPNGKVTESRWYEFGRKMQLLTYDTTGQVISRVVLKPDTREITFAYPNGKVRYRTAVACYENQGAATWYYNSGKPEVSFNYAADKRDGPFKSYHPNGKTYLEGRYGAGEREGEWREYYASGQLRSKAFYRQGNIDGTLHGYYENSQPEVQQAFLYGTEQGIGRFYNPAGELVAEKLFERGEVVGFRDGRDPAAPWQRIERMAGTIRTDFANGKPALEETIRAGVREGVRTAYYSTGQVFRRMTLQEGLLTGPLTSYYATGKLMEEEQYLHNERHGRCRYYRPNGTLEREETYRSGEQLGPTVYFNPEGKPTKKEFHWSQYVYEGK